ncbi:hypothetical protein BJ993_002299 [Nocardioides aromaticivorans]|uniref:Uncharacterized protein n=1 Tax=Nocardioides aromaticivorans TaxID=200618 RepID=A0A7Y9ZGV5_9ACTN|nr:hypothetical protein [Nocardioides aromaticivorans]NYI45219.1 hypothetical protein [Nocardioides aromaticivorans]
MTWNETHERTRIIREVEAAAAVDMSGALPWREEWNQYFSGPHGLVAALRARWQHMCEAQLDVQDGEDQFQDAYTRLRRTQSAILAILQRADAAHAAAAAVDLLTLTGPRPAPSLARARRLHLRGPVLPV